MLVVINNGPRRVVRSTGMKVSTAGWDQTRQRHPDRVVKQAQSINRQDMDKLQVECAATGKDPVEVSRQLSGKDSGARSLVIPFARSQGVNFRPLVARLPESLAWGDITPRWMRAWQEELISQGRAKNSVREYVSKIKVIMRRAMTNGVASFDMDAFRSISPRGEDATSVYLTKDELRRLAAADLPPSLDNARRLFLVGAYTGLRHSDYKLLRPDDFQGDYLTWRHQKTGEVTTIPIPDALRDLVAGGLPEATSMTHLNRVIKEACRLAGIDEPVTWSRTAGRRKVNKVVPKWKVVSTHTARRSFATNLYLGGVDVISIMRFTGHRTTQSFMKYIRVTGRETAERLKDTLKSFW